jgi:hypothetical protein
VLPGVHTVTPRVVPAGWLARTQEAGTAGGAGGGSGAARGSEDDARRWLVPLEWDHMYGGEH